MVTKKLWKKEVDTFSRISWRSTQDKTITIEIRDLAKETGDKSDAGRWSVYPARNNICIPKVSKIVIGKQKAISTAAYFKHQMESKLKAEAKGSASLRAEAIINAEYTEDELLGLSPMSNKKEERLIKLNNIRKFGRI
jgi:hypothetical protein